MGWQALKDIIDQSKDDIKSEAAKKKTECGMCGEPLTFNSKGLAACTFCGYVEK